MGVDITMSIVKNKKYIKEDIFDGRNGAWFDRITQCRIEPYTFLPIKYGYSDQAPDSFKEHYNKENGYYDFRYFNVGDFRQWFERYNPNLDVGWVTKRTAWKMDYQGYVPFDNEIFYELTKEDPIEDRVFKTFKDNESCDEWLYNYILENNIPWDADIIYCFDC